MKKIYKQFYKIKRKFLLGTMPKNSICAEMGVWKGEAKKAVDEFSQNENIKKIQIKNGQFILQKI